MLIQAQGNITLNDQVVAAGEFYVSTSIAHGCYIVTHNSMDLI